MVLLRVGHLLTSEDVRFWPKDSTPIHLIPILIKTQDTIKPQSKDFAV